MSILLFSIFVRTILPNSTHALPNSTRRGEGSFNVDVRYKIQTALFTTRRGRHVICFESYYVGSSKAGLWINFQKSMKKKQCCLISLNCIRRIGLEVPRRSIWRYGDFHTFLSLDDCDFVGLYTCVLQFINPYSRDLWEIIYCRKMVFPQNHHLLCYLRKRNR